MLQENPLTDFKDENEVKPRTDVVGIFPTDEASIMRLIGAGLFEQNGVWQTSSLHMMVRVFAQVFDPRV